MLKTLDKVFIIINIYIYVLFLIYFIKINILQKKFSRIIKYSSIKYTFKGQMKNSIA